MSSKIRMRQANMRSQQQHWRKGLEGAAVAQHKTKQNTGGTVGGHVGRGETRYVRNSGSTLSLCARTRDGRRPRLGRRSVLYIYVRRCRYGGVIGRWCITGREGRTRHRADSFLLYAARASTNRIHRRCAHLRHRAALLISVSV